MSEGERLLIALGKLERLGVKVGTDADYLGHCFGLKITFVKSTLDHLIWEGLVERVAPDGVELYRLTQAGKEDYKNHIAAGGL